LKSSNKIIEKLCRHSWPGNVRELQHLVEKAVILCDERVLQPSDFFFYGINIQKHKLPQPSGKTKKTINPKSN